MMRKLLFVLLLLSLSTVSLRAQVTPANAQITAATTNATCVGGPYNGGQVDIAPSFNINTIGVSVTGTWSATLNIQLSTDHGKTWTASGSTFTANQQSVISVAGYSDLCVFASAYTSGTAQITFSQSTGPLLSGSGTTTVTGNVTVVQPTGSALQAQVQGTATGDAAASGNPVQVGGVDAAGNIQELPVADAGTAAPAQTLLVGGSNGTNVYPLCVNSTVGQLCSAAQTVGTDGFTNGALGQDVGQTGGGLLKIFGLYLFNGATWDRAITCSNTSTFSVASTVTQVIAASGTTKIRICSFDINPATTTAGSADLVYGTGTNCGTGTTTLTGAYTLPAVAVVDITPSTLSATSPLTTPASQAVCVRAVTSTVNGFIVWEQH
jgi:hypothetical protein